MIELGVNIDHVATLRQARRSYEPDPVWAAVEAHLGGADGITVHLREDRRHIQDHDVRRLRELVHIKLNLEMAATDEMVAIACSLKPEMAMLVPEGRQEITTEGGLDIAGQEPRLKSVVAALADAGIMTSVFIDALPEQVDAAARIGARVCEVHTGPYAHAFHAKGRDRDSPAVVAELTKIRDAGAAIRALGMRFNAGHALNYFNVQPVATLPGVAELHIGHAIVSRSLFVGLREAVRQMKALIREAAVYVIVLMLPLFFAALVWPARRVWAIRAVEMLVALILSKFAIVAVLALGGAALDHAASFSVTSLLAGLTLVLLAAFSPWVLLRLLPLHEIASAAAGGMRAASLQPLLDSAASGSQLAGDVAEHRAWLPEIARTARNGATPDEPPLPPQQDGLSEPVCEESIEAAAEEAATAVAVSGGATIGPAGAPEPPSSAAAPTESPKGAPEPGDGEFFTAPGADTLPEPWHRKWEPLDLRPEADAYRPVGEPTPGDGKPPNVDPPNVSSKGLTMNPIAIMSAIASTVKAMQAAVASRDE